MSNSKTSLGRGSIQRADVVPNFIRQAHTGLTTAPTAKRVARAASPLPSVMPLARARKVMALKDLGKGVFENTQDGSVWWREGNLLKRRATDKDRVVGEYLAECRAKEKRTAALKCAQPKKSKESK